MTDIDAQAGRDVQPPKTKRILHIQCTGNQSQAQLTEIAQQFAKAAAGNSDAVISTSDQVQVFNIDVPADYPIRAVTVQPTLTALDIAAVAHEVNRGYCESIGDLSQKPWDQAEAWQRESMYMGVLFQLRAPSTPRDRHEAWLKTKAADGWTYGFVKDAEAKTHPAFLPYDELPLEQKVKDYLSGAVVQALRAKLPIANPAAIKKIEVFMAAGEASADWHPFEFLQLQPGIVFRFVATPEKMYRATTLPYVNYAGTDASYTIDVEEVEMQVAPAAEVAVEVEAGASTGALAANATTLAEVLEDEPCGEAVIPEGEVSSEMWTNDTNDA